MNTFTKIKVATLFLSFASLGAMQQGATFEKFWKEFKASGAGSASFSSKNITDFPSFWKEFKASGSGSASFSSRNIADFATFWAEFKASGSGGASFSYSSVDK